jgi:hypothetical protein
MDETNNKIGVEAGERLSKEGKKDLANLEQEGLKLLKTGKMSVLQPGLKIPEKPK